MKKLESIEIKSLDQKFKEGDQQAFMKLHESVSKRYKYLAFTFNIDFDDFKGILAERMLRLRKAYDPEKSQFSTYLAQNIPSLIHKIKEFKDLILVDINQDRLDRQMISEGKITQTTRQRLSTFSIDAPTNPDSNSNIFNDITPSRDLPLSEVVAGNLLINKIAVIIATKYPNDPYAEYILKTLQQRQDFPKELPRKGPYSELKKNENEMKLIETFF